MAAGTDLSCHKDRTNYLRLNRAIVDLGTSVLREILQQNVQSQDIQQELKKFPNIKLNTVQKQTLAAVGSNGYRYFDISFLYLLIRNLCTKIKPTNGWNPKNPPNDTEITIGDDVERIRFIRNYIHGHMPETCVLEGAFQSHWKVLEDVMTRMDAILGSHFAQDLAMIKTDNMDFYALKELQQSRIKKWSDDEKIFCNTRASECVKKSVKSKPMTVITGAPGSGKSAIAHHVAIELQSEGYTVVCVESVEDLQKNWETACDQKVKKLVIVMDDVFGVHIFDEVELGNWYKRIENVKVCLEGNKIIITMRKHISSDSRFTSFSSEFEHEKIEIDNEQLLLSEKEKMNIFTIHINNAGKNEECTSEIINCNLFCFPLLCQLFAADDSNISVSSFFKNPFPILKGQIRNLKNFGKEKFLGLVLCAIHDNKLSENIFEVGKESDEMKNKREDFAEICRLPRNVSRQDVQVNLDSLLGTYVLKVGGFYTFVHDIIHDVVVNALTPEFHRCILEHCSSNFISERIRFLSTIQSDNSNKDSQPYVILTEGLQTKWAQRLVRDVKNRHFYDVFFNVCLQDDNYEKIFSDCLAENENNIDINQFYECISTCEDGITDEAINRLLNKDKNKIYGLSWYLSKCDITPLHLIVANNLKETFLFLRIEQCTLFSQRGSLAAELLNISVIVDNMLVIQSFIDAGISLNVFDKLGNTPLQRAIMFKQDQMVGILIDKGADINKGDKKGNTPLHTAILFRQDKMVEILIEKGSDINKGDKYGFTPLQTAIEINQDKMVEILIDKGADSNRSNVYGITPLHQAIRDRQNKMVDILIDKGADMNRSGIYGITPLHHAILDKQDKMVEILIDKGADINKGDSNGFTPLNKAIMLKQNKMVEILIDKGADINKSFVFGITPLQHAIMNRQDKMAEILIEKGADINKCNYDGDTPLDEAMRHGLDKTVEILLKKGAAKKCTRSCLIL